MYIRQQKLTWAFEVVWFDTTHVRWLLRQQNAHEVIQACFKLSGSLQNGENNIGFLEFFTDIMLSGYPYRARRENYLTTVRMNVRSPVCKPNALPIELSAMGVK